MFHKNILGLLALCFAGIGSAAANAASLPISPICDRSAEVVEIVGDTVKLNVVSASPSDIQPEHIDGDIEDCNLTELPNVIEYDLCGFDVKGLETGAEIKVSTQIVFSGGDVFPTPGKPPKPMVERNCIKTVTFK